MHGDSRANTYIVITRIHVNKDVSLSLSRARAQILVTQSDSFSNDNTTV